MYEVRTSILAWNPEREGVGSLDDITNSEAYKAIYKLDNPEGKKYTH